MSSDSGCFEIIVNDGRHSRIIPIELGSASIGRGQDNAVQLDDLNVSRKHARLIREGRRVWVEDLGSGIGIYVNDHKVEARARIYARDIVRIGGFSLELNGEHLRRRGEETTEPSIPWSTGLAADEPTDKTLRPPDPSPELDTTAPDDREEPDDKTEIVRTPSRGTPALRPTPVLGATRITLRPTRSPPALYLLMFCAFVFLATALALVISDPFGGDSVEAPPPASAVTRISAEEPTAEEAAGLALPDETPPPLSDADRLVHKAQDALDSGRFEEAVRLSTAARVLDPEHPEADGLAEAAEAGMLGGE